MDMTMSNGFTELNSEEMLIVDGGDLAQTIYNGVMMTAELVFVAAFAAVGSAGGPVGTAVGTVAAEYIWDAAFGYNSLGNLIDRD